MKRPTIDEIRAALDLGAAGEPPEGLKERIQRGIPADLPRREAPAGWGRADWFRLAATLVLVSGGVVLGYRLALWMRSAAPEGSVARLVPRSGGPLTLPTDGLPIQAVPASYVSTREAPRSTMGVDPAPFAEEEARRWLRQGKLPPTDAVPPLSWAGFFDRAEEGGEPIVVEGGPSPLNPDPAYRLLRVAVEIPPPPPVPRPPLEVTVMLDLHEANGQMERIERSLREAAGDLRAHDRLKLVFETDLPRTGAPDGEVLVRERQEFVFIGEPATPQPPGKAPEHRMIRIVRSGEPLLWTAREEGRPARQEEVRTILLQAPGAPVPPVPPAPPAAPGVPAPPSSVVSVAPDDLPDALRETVRAVSGGRALEVEFNPRVVEYYRLVGRGRPAPSERGGPGRVVALYEIKLAPGAPHDAVVAELRLAGGEHAAVRTLELKRAELAASMEHASAALKAAAFSAQWTAAMAEGKELQEQEVRRLAEEVRRLAKENVLMEQQACELQALVDAARREHAPHAK